MSCIEPLGTERTIWFPDRAPENIGSRCSLVANRIEELPNVSFLGVVSISTKRHSEWCASASQDITAQMPLPSGAKSNPTPLTTAMTVDRM